MSDADNVTQTNGVLHQWDAHLFPRSQRHPAPILFSSRKGKLTDDDDDAGGDARWHKVCGS